MTLNAVIALIFRFSLNSTDFQADYITVVEDKPIMSVKYCLQCQSSILAKTITHLAALSLCDSLASCLNMKDTTTFYFVQLQCNWVPLTYAQYLYWYWYTWGLCTGTGTGTWKLGTGTCTGTWTTGTGTGTGTCLLSTWYKTDDFQ